ncbi:MAG: ribosomal L7Ae/L30e/S12e/Gadd45 family protein [Gemmatimonadota bacterium]
MMTAQSDVHARLLGLVGLGVRAQNAVVGVDRVRDAARRGRLRLAVIAPDASRHSLDKVVPLLRARGVRMIEGPGAAALGAAVGREAAAAVGILDAALAAGMRRLIDGSREEVGERGGRGKKPGPHGPPGGTA